MSHFSGLVVLTVDVDAKKLFEFATETEAFLPTFGGLSLYSFFLL